MGKRAASALARLVSATASGVRSGARTSVRLGRSARRSFAGLPLAVATVVTIAVSGAALTIGWWLGDDPDARERAIRVSHAEFDVPIDWQRLSRPPDVPGLGAESLTAYAADPDARHGALVLGFLRPHGETLLSASLSRAVRTWRRPTPTGLGSSDAFRYDIALRDRHLRLYVIPALSRETNVAIICLSRTATASRDFAARCDRVAASARIDDARPYNRAATVAYAKRLVKLVRPLNKARASLRRRVRRTPGPAAQAKVVDRLAGVNRETAERAKKLAYEPPLGPTNGRVVRALTSVAAAYDDFAGATREQDKARFEDARGAVTARERELRRLLDRIDALAEPR